MPCTALAVAALLLTARAGTPACDALPEPARARAEGLMAAIGAHDCCDRPLAECLRREAPAPLVERLAEGVCRRVAEGRDDAAIRLALAQRAWSMLPAPEWASIAREGALSAGDPTAPVELVAFASPRGVHCSRVVPALHRAVTAGPLRGKVHLALVLFPLRANEHDKEAGLALLAAEPSGASWELLLTGYERFDAFSLEAQRGWAVELGLDPAELERRAADPALLARLAEGKRQGAELGVDATPTFFLDGRRWQGELDPIELIDALEEAWERSQGLACRGEPS